jgi:glycerol-1-phosphate dehydrogenase [NAD(P)+]
MNGYASGIAALISGGLKITAPARPPRAIVLDTDVLARAPLALTRAGIGDLLSKPVSDSDWWLSDRLEGTGYGELPGRIVDAAVAEASARAAGLATGDAAAQAALGRALVLSGVAMVVAGSSAPASGGEHLLSHLWDMEALAAGRETRLHGAQVGVATCISAALYQRLLRLDRPSFTEPPPWAEEEARLRAEHGALAPSVLGPAKRKHGRAAERIAWLRDHWPELRDALAARRLPTPAEVRAPLAACGAPHTLAMLGEDRANAARVFRLARDIRDRVTVLDVAWELGVLPGAVDAVLDESGV